MVVGSDELVVKRGNGIDGLREMIVKLEIREGKWIIGMEGANASSEL